MRRDHPRACGEHNAKTAPLLSPWGSSPRLRGTPQRAAEADRDDGIIPALAGNTRTARASTWARRDHPRACGEHHRMTRHIHQVPGSSPRLRGTREDLAGVYQVRGIIPALAGNTYSGHGKKPRYWDHPRACGEHDGRGVDVLALAGSSPRLRGTRWSWSA